jgi:hypothetical protein
LIWSCFSMFALVSFQKYVGWKVTTISACTNHLRHFIMVFSPSLQYLSTWSALVPCVSYLRATMHF